MQSFLIKLKFTIMSRGLIFTDEDLKMIFPEKKSSALHNLISYHIKKKNILQYRRGLYSLNNQVASSYLPNTQFSKYTLANHLYLPSYISFESALSFHGLIPETVYEITSACYSQKKKFYKSPIGNFSFTYSPVKPFFLEVNQDKKGGFLVATAMRSLFDLIYLKKYIYKTLKDIEDDLRIDLDDLYKLSQGWRAQDILNLGNLYKKKSTQRLAHFIVKKLK